MQWCDISVSLFDGTVESFRIKITISRVVDTPAKELQSILEGQSTYSLLALVGSHADTGNSLSLNSASGRQPTFLARPWNPFPVCICSYPLSIVIYHRRKSQVERLYKSTSGFVLVSNRALLVSCCGAPFFFFINHDKHGSRRVNKFARELWFLA